MLRRVSLLSISLLLLSACQRSEPPGNVPNQSSANSNGEKALEVKLKSTAFDEDGMIPKQYTCDGPNISPPLQWDAVASVKTYALIADDPDAPAKTWVHWVLFNLPPGIRFLPENVPPQDKLQIGGQQGTNDFRKIGYGGPCPPSGTHRYYFKLYALDTELQLDSSATKDQLLKAMEGHILAQGQLMGKYERQK